MTRTGLLVVLGGSKVVSLYHQRKKPAKLYWTLASRRAHKKLNNEAGAKKRARRVVKVQRGYVGMKEGTTIETVRKANEEARKAASAAKPAAAKGGKIIQAAVAEAKARQKAAQAERKKSGAAAGGRTGAGAAVAKHAGKGR